MKRVICKRCGQLVPLIRGLNCRVYNSEREYGVLDMQFTCKLDVYCGECGVTTEFAIKHYFDRKVFDILPTDALVALTLDSNDIVTGE